MPTIESSAEAAALLMSSISVIHMVRCIDDTNDVSRNVPGQRMSSQNGRGPNDFWPIVLAIIPIGYQPEPLLFDANQPLNSLQPPSILTLQAASRRYASSASRRTSGQV
ncbi:unnamed protein product [Protopolystoma xenopodis]|uniref:Uncharacterized protein n=1 Tax=Protopolystoma xenopodis TaxID=117903 RepID=A0A448WYW8_9PLAT|nr:unnamed protein product [Protopolystoma xenopodis]